MRNMKSRVSAKSKSVKSRKAEGKKQLILDQTDRRRRRCLFDWTIWSNQRRRCRGSRYSRRPSPIKLNAKTVSAIANLGKISACGAACSVDKSRASSIITPQEGAGAGTRSPRKESEASDKTAPAMPKLAWTIKGGIAFGKM